MKAPEKIYIPLYPNYDLDGFHLADEWMYEPHKEVENAEYIHKRALLDLLRKKEEGALALSVKLCYRTIFDEISKL